ncbi:synaptosomal-associated protein 47 isoform X2 [Fukomys damarensis]|uniref:synaptosomal-associated protein 47 isoform X2 n=1 Tax=Fukomys damarensis TaxID=885580 RepID=UPI0008FF2D0F|nr:synaptosomal-associated protein 47 isoform X2 [Fukomys damarensis]
MSSDVCVHSWPCSYYLDLEKRWVPGKLSLTPHSLKFTADRVGEVLMGLPLSSVVAIRKEASHFIFSAITILERGHLKHWFSSLRPSRNVVFNIIEHFWRELLLSQEGTAAEASPSTLTRGQELTGLMSSSQRRLEDTAKVLHHQGEQLDSVMRGLDKMEADLDVADRLLTELESPSWWPFRSSLWRTPEEGKPRDTASVAVASGLMGCAAHRELPTGGQEGRQQQLQRAQPLFSKEDAGELTQILSKLKGLALDTEAELERQDAALDGITTAVDHATLTVDKHNRRMKRLT